MIDIIWEDLLKPEIKRIRRISKLWWKKQTPWSIIKSITTTVVVSLMFYAAIVVLFAAF